MQLPALRSLFACVAACLITSLGFAEATLALPVTSEPLDIKPGKFVFSLVPSSFSASPLLNMTVMCELTPYGRTLPQATAQSPVYYISQDGGFRSMGQPGGDSRPPDAGYLNQILQRSLAGNGYLPAKENHSPALVLIYHWGTHQSAMRPYDDFISSLSDTPDETRRLDLSTLSIQQTFREQLERARLIGGNAMAGAARNQMEFGFPVLDSVANGNALFAQQVGDLYYVLVSAYDATELALTNQRRLVWRARLTVAARGVAMNEAVPSLVLTASTVFGRDSGSPQVVMRKLRRGQVKLAPMEVLESDAGKIIPEKRAIGRRMDTA